MARAVGRARAVVDCRSYVVQRVTPNVRGPWRTASARRHMRTSSNASRFVADPPLNPSDVTRAGDDASATGSSSPPPGSRRRRRRDGTAEHGDVASGPRLWPLGVSITLPAGVLGAALV